MDRFASHARKLVEAAALGLLAVAPLYVAPASIAARLDAWLFDLWSRAAPAAASPAIALAAADTPAALHELTQAARNAGIDLIVTTLPTAVDAPTPGPTVIGPTEVAAGPQRSRATGWSGGGALLFEPELDGVVRRAGLGTPSLAAAGAAALNAAAGPDDPTRPLLRFARRDALPSWAPGNEAADAATVRVLVAGPPGAAHTTPLGVVSTPELVALALNAHSARAYVVERPVAELAVWLASLALIALAGVGHRSRASTLALSLGGAASLAAGSAAAFTQAGLWLPVTGPSTWLVLAGTLLALRRPASQSVQRSAQQSDVSARVTRARQAVRDGNAEDAWSYYRELPASIELLPELYELACSLQARGADDEAAELFHRIAQTDSQFRDVARRLVRGLDTDTPTEQPEAMPRVIGRYELLEHIGRGAMGDVYLGRDPIINRILAVKAIDLSIGYDHEAMESTTESFLREATIAGSLSHPNIVTIYDVGETDGLAYIAMEYVRGHHLSEFAAADRLLPVATVLDLAARAADALDYAHRHNIVHRDIKPANIMYDWISNNLKITDFGIAKLIDANRTRTGIVLGTPAYMSPEQLEGRNVNGHTDLFALGVSLYQLLTAQLPFRGASMTNLMFVIANEPHESVTRLRADLPKSLDAIVDRALAKDPSDRFQSGAEMAAALRNAA